MTAPIEAIDGLRPPAVIGSEAANGRFSLFLVVDS